jgi:CRP-like cAMP-binding protein
MRSATEYFIFLRHVPLFKGLTGIQLRQLTAQLDFTRFRAGEVIFAEGEPSQHFYIIMSGRVRIVKAYGKPDEQILATLGKTDFFGDMGILESKPHSATAVADKATEILSLSADTFQHLLRHHPSMVFALGRELSARVRHTTRHHFRDA